MSATPAVLVFDAGTGGGRASIFDLEGVELARASEDWDFQCLPELGVMGWEFDAEAFWQVLARCSRRAQQQAGRPDVRAVAATALRGGSVLLDSQGRSLAASPIRDVRGIEALVQIEQHVPDLLACTGRAPLWLSPLARLLWYRQERPDLFARAACFLPIGDWVVSQLTDMRTTTVGSAADTLMLDLQAGHWNADTLAALDLDERLLPSIVEQGSTVGPVTAHAAEQAGLVAGTPVVAVAGDTHCAMVGSGAVSPGLDVVVTGSSGQVVRTTSEPIFDASHKAWTGCHGVDQVWLLECAAGQGGLILEWALDLFLPGSADPYRALAEEAGQVAPGSCYSYALLGPEPFDLTRMNPAQPAAFLFPPRDRGVHVGRAELLRATLENMAYSIRSNLGQVDGAAGASSGAIALSGGMSRSDLFCQIVADVSGRPVKVARDWASAARGGAAIACVALGAYDSLAEAVHSMVDWRLELEPEPEAHSTYLASHGMWLERLELLRQI